MEIETRYVTLYGYTYQRINGYGLACGYKQRIEEGDRSVNLWREGGVYHVQFIDRSMPGGRMEWYENWQTFVWLPEARRFFAKFARQVKYGPSYTLYGCLGGLGNPLACGTYARCLKQLTALACSHKERDDAMMVVGGY